MNFLQNYFLNIEFKNLYLLVVSIFTAIVLMFLFYVLLKTKNKKSSRNNTSAKTPVVITSQDIKAIAGDNVITTQLDLARAYIEMGKKQLAKKILEHVIDHGNSVQQHEAKSLITAIEISA